MDESTHDNWCFNGSFAQLALLWCVIWLEYAIKSQRQRTNGNGKSVYRACTQPRSIFLRWSKKWSADEMCPVCRWKLNAVKCETGVPLIWLHAEPHSLNLRIDTKECTLIHSAGTGLWANVSTYFRPHGKRPHKICIYANADGENINGSHS